MSARYTDLRVRCEALRPAMVAYYVQRLDQLVSTRAAEDAWQAFEKRLRVAEELSAGPRTTPARRLRGGH